MTTRTRIVNQPRYDIDTFITEQPESVGGGIVVHRGDGSPSGHKVGRYADSLKALDAAQREAQEFGVRLWFCPTSNDMWEMQT